MSRPLHILLRYVVLRCLIVCWCVALLPVLLLSQLSSTRQTSSTRDTLLLTISSALKDSLVQLPHQFVVTGTDSLQLSPGRRLRAGIDYRLNYRNGTLSLDSATLSQVLSDSTAGKLLRIQYSYLPFRFQESYYKRTLVVLKDSAGRDSMKVSRPRSSFDIDDIFGQNLQKSGSLVRGFTVGSNQDLTPNSGLRLQLAGKVASDLEVVAVLTDESTPIQPEGTTQALQEFDKVFVEMRGSDFTATLGDFNLDFGGTEFARLSRKLQGAKGTADYRMGFSNGNVILSGAVPRGKYVTKQFQGLEGVQGPYRLSGKNNERSIVLIAGSERVYIDGELQTRGETNDYTIDYSIAELTFTTRKLITAASRITIDFEYTDRQYSRSLFAGQTSSRFFENKAAFTFSYLREADNQDAPIDFAITDSARRVLARAGDDRNKAVLSGVTQVDSNGYYVRVDTLLGTGQQTQFYRYAPARTAQYNVTFSNVGFGLGEYVRESVGVFVWKGPGVGDYLPIRYLPLPQAQQTMDFRLDVSPINDMKVSGEMATSNFDANRFSSLDDGDNTGHAFNLTLGYAPRDVRVGGGSIGSFELLAKERYVNRQFSFVDRVNDIEFNRKWGIDSATSSNEELQEASLKYLPVPQIVVGGGYGRIHRGVALNSNRMEGSLLTKGEGLPSVQYFLEKVQSDEAIADNSSRWLRNKGSIEYSFAGLTPSFRYEGENRKISSLSTSSLKPGSFRFNVFAPGLQVEGLGPVHLGTDFEWRNDNLFNDGSVIRESQSFTQAYRAALSEWNNLMASIDVTLREKKYTPPFQQLGNSDIQTVLVRNQDRFTTLNRGVETDVFYEVATERSARMERVFVRVTPGTGNYHYRGDLNGNGIADEDEYEPARFDGDFNAVTLPSEQLYPIIDLKTSLRLRITPKQFLLAENGGVSKLLSALSTETYVRVEEKSTEPDLKQIYLLHFSAFQNDSTTIAGSTLFTQDINVMEGSPDVSVRFRYAQRTGLNNFTSGTERSYTRDRSIRLRLQLLNEVANQIDYMNRIDRLSSPQPSSRLRDVLSNSLAYDLSYRPEQDLEVGFRLELGKSTDRYQTPELDADINTQSLRAVYAFHGSGQLRMEASREEVRLSESVAVFPFELTGGRVEGLTWLWRVAFDYRLTDFIQATLNYDGRSEGGRSPVHTARAEVRAFF
ncbi:MAG TPA: hypothetical protein DGH68_09335 [Bacteroidetes bacterium]|nr:hypothetical protein [Bacteroidota bacterium]